MFNFSHSLLIPTRSLGTAVCDNRQTGWIEGMRVENLDCHQSRTNHPETIGSNVEVAPVRTSPLIGCSSGSMQTSLQTSVKILAVKSLISLCLVDGNHLLSMLHGELGTIMKWNLKFVECKAKLFNWQSG